MTAKLKNRIARWSVILILACLAIFIAGIYLLPSVISTERVLNRFQQEISTAIGQNVTFDNTPEIRIWPTASITLDNFIIGPSDEREGEVLMIAEQFSADINLLSTLTGEPSFSNFVLTRPTVHFELYQNGTSNWFPKTMFADGALSSSQDPPNLQTVTFEQAPSSLNLGTLSVIGGTIDFVSDPGAEAERLSSINGTFSWPGLNSALSLNLSAIIRGEEIELQVSDLDLSLLLAGEITEPQISLNSALINLTYSGSLHSTDKLLIDGALQVVTPSARRALEWAGNDIKPGAALGAIDLTTHVSGTLEAAKFEDLIIRIEGNRGLGILDYTIVEGEPPMISGTLAFNTLDIENFMRAFTPLPQSGEDIAETIDTRFLKQLGLDLRMSAQAANFGPVELSNLAAAVLINKDGASFNIGGSNAYGGQLISKVSISERGIDGGGQVSVSARQINFADFFNTIELNGPLPQGVGDINIKLSSERPLWATDLNNIKGKFDMTLNEGTIPNLNLQTLIEFSELRDFFNLADVSDGSMAFESTRLSADINAGVARLNDAHIITENEKLTFNGIVPFAKGSLAVFGTIYDRIEIDGDNVDTDGGSGFSPSSSLSLFIGGSWPNPVFSPPIPDGQFQ